VECNALKILVHVLESSSGTEYDDLIKYVPLGLKQLAAALGVHNPHHHTEGAQEHDDQHPEHLDEKIFGSAAVQNTTKVS
jgi:hypothetical protein